MNELLKSAVVVCALVANHVSSMAQGAAAAGMQEVQNASDMAPAQPSSEPALDTLLESEPPAAGSAPATFKIGSRQFYVQSCAKEGKSCSVPRDATKTMAFGAGNSFRVRNVASGAVPCTAAYFGDPLPGVVKACFLAVSKTALSDGSPNAPSESSGKAAPPSQAQSDAARFLVQASYGPNMKEIEAVAKTGPAAWIERQFTTAPMDSHWAYVIERKGPFGCHPCDSEYVNAVMESFWLQAIRGPDQLRQRLVFALSEIFVVSTVNSPVAIQKDAHASYLDMLSRNAFGNFRTLLEQVALHPTMGHYLSYIRNRKEDAVTGRLPDENFAREVMQLFTIGLWQLNNDGSRKKDVNGNDIPTYVQADVMGLAKVFTGWSWGNGDWASGAVKPVPVYDRYAKAWNLPMRNYAQYHSTSEKRLVNGVVIPENTPGEQSLKIALDTLFNHPNVGPFIGTQLIKRFVTSNPSPAYISRVSAAFNNNGRGVRGDMKAVITAVLLDPEARDPAKVADVNWGKLREPMIRYANFMRAFNVQAPSGKYKLWNLENPVSSIGQNPLRSPSVFNWYRDVYAPPGDVMDKGLVAPEFGITHETTTTGYANFVTSVAERQSAWWRDNMAKKWGPTNDYLGADYSVEMALATNPAALVERINLLLAAGRLSASTKQTIVEAVSSIPATTSAGHTRVAMAVALTMVSPEFIVQK